jgi:protein ImuA
MPHDNKPALEELHPSLWRASQLARGNVRCVDSGHPALDLQLPGGGWPTGCLVDLMMPTPGIGEVRLLAPALAKVAQRGVVLLQPPQTPQALAFAGLGIQPSQLIWLKPTKTGDALWAAAEVLNSGSVGALLFWVNHARNDSLRRLHLAAQGSETLFFLMRPLASVQDASPAPLRLSVQPVLDGIEIGFVKRRGPARDTKLFLPLAPPVSFKRHSTPEQTPSAPKRQTDALPLGKAHASLVPQDR